MRKKIAVALAAGVAFGTMFSAPVAAPVAEAASESVLTQNMIETYTAQGDKLYSEKRFAEAAEIYKKAVEGAPNNDALWFKCANAYYDAGTYDKSVHCCKQAIKINPNNGLYYNLCGLAYYKQVFVPHSLSRRTILERAVEYEERAVELIPNAANIRQAAGVIQEGLAACVGSTREKHLKKAYQHLCTAVDLAPNDEKKANELARFVQNWSRYGFQPYGSTTQSANPSAGTTGNRPTAPLNTPESLTTDGTTIQEMLRTGTIKAYNAGAGFEWWDEEARADFEALPFPDDIEVVAGNVYRVTWDDDNPDYITYVVLVPRHVRIFYGPGEEDAHDSLLIVEIASKGYDDKGAVSLTPTTMMNDRCYLRKGRTKEIVHFGGEKFDWKWLEEGQKEIEEQQGSALPMLGAETYYTFEESGNPDVIILRGHCDERTWSGKMELVPSVVTPPFQG